MRAGSRVGTSSSRCCSANWGGRIRCAKSAGAWPVARAGWPTWVSRRRATLAFANAHHPWPLYEQVFYQLLARRRAVAGPKKFRFKNKLLSLDATIIDLCAELFPWAAFRRTKGAVKLHFTLDHDGYLPTALVITPGKRHEVTMARQQRFAPSTILVFDRGYIDFTWFAALEAGKVFFVTRLKEGTAYEVVHHRARPTRGGVIADDWTLLTGARAAKAYPHGLRRVEVETPEGAGSCS